MCRLHSERRKKGKRKTHSVKIKILRPSRSVHKLTTLPLQSLGLLLRLELRLVIHPSVLSILLTTLNFRLRSGLSIVCYRYGGEGGNGDGLGRGGDEGGNVGEGVGRGGS